MSILDTMKYCLRNIAFLGTSTHKIETNQWEYFLHKFHRDALPLKDDS